MSIHLFLFSYKPSAMLGSLYGRNRWYLALPDSLCPTSAEKRESIKVLAVFGRAEARDFVDLAALEPVHSLLHLCRLAVQKDLGFRPDVFGQMLDHFDRLPRDEFGIDDQAFEQLKTTIRGWKQTLRDDGATGRQTSGL